MIGIMSCIAAALVLATSVTITEPIDGETYDGDWLPLRVIVENDNELPDSVHYSLNGQAVVTIPRLNTDWPTYMHDFQNIGYSVSPAPLDNTVLWMAPVTGEHHEFPTPVTAEGIVYYTSDSMGMAKTDTLFALDAATGQILWTYDTGHADDAVSVVDGKLYTAADSIYCLDALTGALLWVNGCADRGGSTPAVTDDGRVFCGVRASEGSEETVFCLDASDGSAIWSTVLPAGTQASCMSYSGNGLFVPTYRVGIGAALYALNMSDGEILWQNTDSYQGYWDSSPVVLEGMIYICDHDGYARAVSATTGQTEWATPITVGEYYISATPVLAYDRMFFGDQVHSIHCLNPSDGSVLWSTPEVIQHGSSGVADSVLFFGESLILPFSDSSLLYDSACVRAFNCFSGVELWNYKTACSQYQGHSSSPSITDGIMYYACTDGYLYAFGTGLKYTYREDYFYAAVGSNELIVSSFDGGSAVTADTISFMVTQTGISPDPASRLSLRASPNPFSSSSVIFFDLAAPGLTTVRIYDLSGRAVETLLQTELIEGEHTVTLDGSGLASGVYLIRLRSGMQTASARMVLVR